MGAIHVVIDLRVEGFGHEQIQREAVQQAFDRAFPVTRVRTNPQQLAGKRQVLGIDTQRCGETPSYANAVGGDIARAALQRADFVRQQLVALAAALELDRFIDHEAIQALLLRVDFLPAQSRGAY